MRSSNTAWMIALIVVLAIGCYGCSQRENSPSLITGNVISKYGPEETQQIMPDKPSSVNISLNDTLNISTPTVKQVVDKIEAENAPSTTKISADKIPSPLECDQANINLGYKDCFNTTNGDIRLILKNSGYENITGILFNIEIKGSAPNYEIASKGIKMNDFTEYNLTLGKWREEYKSADRIIIIPLKKDNNGQRTCFNRALLLVPQDSCDKYLIQR